MGKNTKRTKKFVKNKLKNEIKLRNERKKVASRFNKKKKGDKKDDGAEQRFPPAINTFFRNGEEDVDIDFAEALNSEKEKKVDLQKLSDKEQAFMRDSDSEFDDEDDKEDGDDQSSSNEDEDDEGEGEGEGEAQEEKTLGEEVEEHKKELEELKKADPEFFDYLAKNDAKLLQFGKDDEFEGADEDGEDDDLDEDGGEDEEEDEQDEGDSEDKKKKFDFDKFRSNKKKISKKMLDAWEKLAIDSNHPKAVWRLILAFRTACHISDEPEQKAKFQDKYAITTSQTFNRVMLFCVKNMVTFLNKIAQYTPSTDDSKPKLPSTARSWNGAKKKAQIFIIHLLHFMRSLSGAEMIVFILKRTQHLIPYFACFPPIARRLLSVLLKFWTNEDPEARALAYINIRALAITVPHPFIDSCLKAVYLTYVRHAKFVNATNLPAVEFMSNCIVDLYGIDFLSSYQHAFVYIRQLAIHLKNSISVKTKDAFKNVYNWQFMNSLRVFSKMLTHYAGQPDLQHLVYPTIQLILGTIRLIPTARFYPLRFLCIRFVNEISRANNIFVPILPYLLDVLDCSDLQRRPKQGVTNAKPIMFDVALKISKQLLGTRVFQDGVISHFVELLLEFFTINAYNIAFPELIVPAIVHLKRYAKKSTIPPIKKQILTVVEKIQLNADFITNHRNTLECSPKDVKEIATFLEEEKKSSKSPLVVYFKQFLGNLAETRKQAGRDTENSRDGEDDGDDVDMSEEDQNDEYDDEEEDQKPKKSNKRKTESAPVTKKSKKQEPKSKKAKKQKSGDDIVQDLVLSDDE